MPVEKKKRTSRKRGVKQTPARLRKTLESKAGNTVFHVQFVKRTNGEMRDMNCRLGVSKGVKGSGMGYDPKAKNLLTVYDIDKRGYRTIPLDQIIYAKVRGEIVLGPLACQHIRNGGKLW